MAVRPVNGQLFSFSDDAARHLPAFISGQEHKRAVIVVPGQTDAPFALYYMAVLAEQLSLAGWALVQATFGSSRPGSRDNHEADSDDLGRLVEALIDDYGMQEGALLSYSTGLQIVSHYMTEGTNRDFVTRVIIHGCLLPVNDPMWATMAEHDRMARCKELVASGRGAEYLPESTYDIPVTAARAVHAATNPLSVQEALWIPGALGQEVLVENLSPFPCPLLVNLSFNTGYAIPPEEREKFEAGIHAAAATPDVTIAFHDDCDEIRRMLRGREAQHASEMVYFLKEQDRKRTERLDAAEADHTTFLRRQRSILAKSKIQL